MYDIRGEAWWMISVYTCCKWRGLGRATDLKNGLEDPERNEEELGL